MPVIFDPHVHLYPCYDLVVALDAAIANLSSHPEAQSAQLAIGLTERADYNCFAKLTRSNLPLQRLPEGILQYTATGASKLLIFPGRQIISSERIEILALLTDQRIPDRELTCTEILSRIRSVGGLPVINWAPGKWWGQRGKIINAIFHDQNNRPLLACDTTLRPCCWPEPDLMRQANRLGVKVLGGSDPLPFKHEEALIAGYSTLLTGSLDLHRPLSSMRALLSNAGSEITRIGQRSSPFQFIYRMTRHYLGASH